MMDEPTNRAMDERLRRLERECRRWRLLGISMAWLAAIGLIAGGARRADGPSNLQADRFSVGDLEARRIVLQDERGRRWFSLKSEDGVPQMAFEGPANGGRRGTDHIPLVL